MAIITLTSDFGTKDFLPGAVKGRLLSVDAGFQLHDNTHNISPFNYTEAVYIIRNSCPHFPKHSYHLLLFNMYDTANKRLLMAYHQGHYFICADNGLLPMIFDGLPDQTIELTLNESARHSVLDCADAIGRAIQKIEHGSGLHQLGAEPDNLVIKHQLKSTQHADWMEGRILFVDRFENVVVDITLAEFEWARKGRQFVIELKGSEKINKLSDDYSQVPEGSMLAFFNSAGYLEIAVNKGNAAGLFGFQAFDGKASQQFMQARMFYQVVRVRFF